MTAFRTSLFFERQVSARAFLQWLFRKLRQEFDRLAPEARRRGIPVFVERRPVSRFHERTAVTYKHEVVTVKGKSQNY